MKLRTGVILILTSVIPAGNALADSYSTFQTKRFYSSNHKYFVEVTGSKRATLYRNGRRIRRIWTRLLPELPRVLLVTNDGSRAAMVEFYYGNNCNPNAPIIDVFGDDGKELAHYLLKDVADLSRTTATTSMCHWYGDARLAQDERSLVIETIVGKYERSKCGDIHSAEEADKMWEICMATVPHEHLLFEMANGRLISREKVAAR